MAIEWSTHDTPQGKLAFFFLLLLLSSLLKECLVMALSHRDHSLGGLPTPTLYLGPWQQPWRTYVHMFIPGTTLASCPLQHFQMAVKSSPETHPLIPRIALASCPLQHFQMAVKSSPETHPLIPGTTLASCPLQHFQMASTSGFSTCPCSSSQGQPWLLAHFSTSKLAPVSGWGACLSHSSPGTALVC